MTLHDYPETDSLYIERRHVPAGATVEINDGLMSDPDAQGQVVGLDLDRASVRCDRSRIETRGLPRPVRAPVETTHAET